MLREARPHLGKTEIEMIGLLGVLGVEHREARILAFLGAAREARSSDIERALRLRQPEVSVALRRMRESGWVASDERRGKGRGRPVQVWRLARSLPDILDLVGHAALSSLDEDLARLDRVRALLAPRSSPPEAEAAAAPPAS